MASLATVADATLHGALTNDVLCVGGRVVERSNFLRALHENDPSANDLLVTQIKSDRKSGGSHGLSILADVYGPQSLVARGLLPSELVFGHPGFLRPCHGIAIPRGAYLHLYAAHLARSAEDGGNRRRQGRDPRRCPLEKSCPQRQPHRAESPRIDPGRWPRTSP